MPSEEWDGQPGLSPLPPPSPLIEPDPPDPFIPKKLPYTDLGGIDWGPLPTKHEYKLAHRLWSLPNSTLEYQDWGNRVNYPVQRDRTEEFLTRNVYADLIDSRSHSFERPCHPDELVIKFPVAHAPADAEGWTYEHLGDLAPARRHPAIDDVLVAGKNMKARWLKPELLAELQRRGFGNRPQGEKWTVKRCKEELFAYQASQTTVPDGQVNVFPRHELGHWGIEQRGHIDNCTDADNGESEEGYLSPFRLYTWALHLSPYNPAYWVFRAYLFHQKGYYDLALGDAYRARYLTELLLDDATRTVIPGLYARVWDAIEEHVYANAQNPYMLDDEGEDLARCQQRATRALRLTRSPEGILDLVPHIRRTIHHIIALNLLSLQAWSDWWKMDCFACGLEETRADYAEPFLLRLQANTVHANRRNTDKENAITRGDIAKCAGSVSGRAFLQSAQDVDRTGEAFLATMNAEFMAPWLGKGDRDPNIEVRRKANGELGVFALKAFDRDELVHIEEPSVRGQVRGAWAFREPGFTPSPVPCENCRRDIPRDRINEPYVGIHAEWSRFDESLRDEHPSICRCINALPRRYFCQPPMPEGIGSGIIGIDLSFPQPIVSREEDEPVNAQTGEGSSAQSRRKWKGKEQAIPDDTGEGPSARTLKLRFGAGKRKVTDADETDQPPTKRMTRSGTRTIEFSKTGGRTIIKKSRHGAKAPVEKPQPIAKESEKTCLQKARESYHFKSCGQAWEWLHCQLSWKDRGGPPRREISSYEEDGTLLSLLLLDVFDRTLLLRTSEPSSQILPHEIKEMLPLCGGEDLPDQYFPFTYSANIVIPFDILLNLRVNIFRELDFDTWVIQTVLRKLLLNCVPWDGWRRGEIDHLYGKDPFFARYQTFYVHTGFAMFNHACIGTANCHWFWDQCTQEQEDDQKGIPNRIIIRTQRATEVNEEITIQYYPGAESRLKQRRLFGRECDCGDCPEPSQLEE